MPKRLAIFAFDTPFPAHRGGRADVWRRLQGLRALGHRVLLVAWYVPGDAPSDDTLSVLQGVADEVLLFPLRRGPLEAFRRLASLPGTPSHVAARLLTQGAQRRVDAAIDRFSPDVVWSEGLYPYAEAARTSKCANVPLVYRSHNVEHVYMQRQARAARHTRDKLALRLACIGLKTFESKALRNADWVFDISCDDLGYWRTEGISHNSWLPPLAEATFSPIPDGPATPIGDVVFLGNLVTPNNVQGVDWLIKEVAPLVHSSRPETSFVIAGSNPGAHVQSLCKAENVTLLPNPKDALAVYRGARVLVNPVQVGSGTHMKAIEMLLTSVPIVTATQGTRGFPEDVKKLFRIADTAPAFANLILDALSGDREFNGDRTAARQLFGLSGLRDALTALDGLGRK